MEPLKFDDLPREITLLRDQIARLTAIVEEKLTTPAGYEPDVTMDVPQIANYLKCTPDNVYKKVKAGTLPHHRAGKLIFFKKKEVDEATEAKQNKRKFFK